MPDVWIDSNASGANDGTSWTDAYADMAAAIAGILTTDDEVWVASNHSETGTANNFMAIPTGVRLYSVSSADDTYTRGASISVTSAGDLGLSTTTSAVTSWQGFDFSSADTIQLTGSAEQIQTFIDCTFTQTTASAGDYIGSQPGDSNIVICRNCTFAFSTSSHGFYIGSAQSYYLYDCTITGSTTLIHVNSGGTGGLSLYIEGSDLSGMGTPASPWLNVGAASSDDTIIIELNRCLLPSVSQYFETLTTNQKAFLTINGCEDPTGDADSYWYSYYESRIGTVETDDTVTYGDMTYDGSAGASLVMTSDAAPYCTDNTPLVWKIAALAAQDLTSSKTYTVSFTSATALNKGDFWIEAVADNTADFAKGETSTSRPADIFATTAHDAGTITWGGSTGALANEYKVSVTVTGGAGFSPNSTVEITAFFAKPAINVVVDPLVVVS